MPIVKTSELTADEIDAIILVVTAELNHAQHTHPDDQSARPSLRTALPKLKVMSRD